MLSLTSIPVFGQTDDLVILETKLGNIVIEFFPEDAPNHIKNFISLAESGFFDNTKFHRIIPGFMIQGGDPNSKTDDKSSWGTGNPGYFIDAEFNNIKHNRGIVSMARSASPNSAGSQFFIVHQDSNFLDGQYTVFGRIVTQESYETLDKIASLQTDSNDAPLDPTKATIKSARVIERSKVSNILDLGPPQRTSETTAPTTTEEDSRYENDKLGISFIAPPNWAIQEPPKTGPEVPDVILVGNKINLVPSSISISIVYSKDKTLDDYVSETEKRLKPAIDAGQLRILSAEKTTINNRDAYIRDAVGTYQMKNSTAEVQFKEISMIVGDKIYTFTYSNEKQYFDTDLEEFETIIDSLYIKGEQESQPEGGGCLIATAAFGSEMSSQVQQLRELRDNVVMNTESGKLFMSEFNKLYYSFSPAVADLERQNPTFQQFVKLSITPLLSSLMILDMVDIDTDVDMLLFGTGIISLNIGFYFVMPTIIIYNIKKHFKNKTPPTGKPVNDDFD